MENLYDYTFKKRFTSDSPLLSSRFYLCDLTLSDVTEKYLSWMNDSIVMQFIESSSETKSKSDLINYLTNRINKDNVRFFGIFSRETNQHIGNIKYEPIDFKNSYAVMGVLIGDKLFRGEAVFGEVYSASSRYIVETYGVNKIYAGVDSSNLSAIRAYEKNGFTIAQSAPISVTAGGFVLCDSRGRV